MSYDLDDEEPPLEQPKTKPKSAQPMPRLWKAEPDPTEEEAPPAKKSTKDGDTEPPRKSSDSKGSVAKGNSKAAKGKGPPATDENGEKKVLIEETPTFDTYETRRRARLIMGALGAACVLLSGWSVYRVFLYDPVGLDATSTADATASKSSPETRPTVDQEADFMLGRAHEFAKNGRTDQAVAMLNRVLTVYKGTPAAREAKAALDRSEKNLPLFSDRPLVLAQNEQPQPPPSASPPPAVVHASPVQPQAAEGQAALVLPANPPEVVVVPPTPAPGAVPTVAGISSRPLPQGFRANLNAGIHESGWPLVIEGERDGAPMFLVPGGTFLMGSNEGRPEEAPAHQVRLSTYYIDQHEVTNRQFRRFLQESHYRGKPAGKWLSDDKVRAEPEDFPVVHVNLLDAEAFATWAAKQIPTEAQWEMGARSTDGRRYPWGDEAVKWSRARVFRQIDPVMTFREDKSPFGIFDMAGNVQEWTTDLFDPRYYQLLVKTITENPSGPSSSSRSRIPQHVVRGAAKNWSVTYREGVPADRRLSYLGFRCVLVVETQGSLPSPSNPAALPGAPPASRPNPPAIPF
jgi:formylglycine-generating enzyme